MCLLGWRVPDGLPAFLGLRSVAIGDLLGDVINHRPAVDVWVGVEEAFLDTLLDDLPDGGLRQRPEIHLPCYLLNLLFSLDANRLYFDLNEVVVGYLVDGVSHDGVEDVKVSNPQLVQLVTLPMGWCFRS
jgi:hypothetical protein